MQVTMEGKYRTVDGKKVRILCIDRIENIPNKAAGDVTNVVALFTTEQGNEVVALYKADGTVSDGVSKSLNLVEITKWDDLVVGEPVMAVNGAAWFKAYYAGLTTINEKVCPSIFTNGCNIWTCGSCVIMPVVDCRKPTIAEIEEHNTTTKVRVMISNEMREVQLDSGFIDIKLRMEDELIEDIDKICSLLEIDKNEFIQKALLQYLDKDANKKDWGKYVNFIKSHIG